MRIVKPRPGAILDRTHPLARGMIVAALFNEGSGKSKNILNPIDATMSTSRPKFRGSPKEQAGLYINYDQGSEEWVDIPGFIPGIPLGKTEVVGIYHEQVNNGLLQRCTENADFDNAGDGLMYESFTVGKWLWEGQAVGGSQVSTTGVAGGYLQHVLVLDKNKGAGLNSGAAYWYINGKSVAYTVDQNSTADIQDYNRRIGGITAAARSIIGVFHYYYKYNRALNEFEAQQLYANPYCMWKEPVFARKIFHSSAPSTPTITTISPNSGHQGDIGLSIDLTGTGFQDGFSGGDAVVAFSGSGITINSTTITGPTTLTVSINIAGGATISSRDVTVQTDFGTSSPIAFSVLGAVPPALTNLSPNTGYANATVPVKFVGVELDGTKLDGGSQVFHPPSGWTITGSGTSTSWMIDITIPAATTPGPYTFTFETVDGESNAITFTVLSPSGGTTVAANNMRGGFVN